MTNDAKSDPAMEAALAIEGLLRHCGVIVTEEMEVGIPAIIRRHNSDREARVQEALKQIESLTKRVRGKSKAQCHDDDVGCDGVNHFFDLEEINCIVTEAISDFEKGGTNE